MAFPAIQADAMSVTGTPSPEHIVQFYDAESELVECVASYLSTGFAAGERGVAIATHAHLVAIENRLTREGFDMANARHRGIYVPLNAADMLSKFMQNGRPDAARFCERLTAAINPSGSKRPVRAFGEMVAILWSEGNASAALELETMWNELIAREHFQLLCAYPMPRFRRESARPSYAHVCALHSRLIPALA
jgi:hypothetical protein